MKSYNFKYLILVLFTLWLGIFGVSPGYALTLGGNLLLCNTLDGDNAVLNSAAGPNLALYEDIGDPIAIEGKQAYVPGVFGNALTLGDGPAYASTLRAHNVVLENADQYLDPEKGTVEVWFMQNADPVPFLRNPYRIFDGFFGLEAGIKLQSHGGGLQLQPPRLEFALTFGGTMTDVFSITDGQLGYDISSITGQWIHIAAVWNRAGIGGSSETLRLYVDGVKVAVSSENGWGTSVGDRIDIGGGNDGDIANRFFLDELKVWGSSKADFSDRFEGGCVLPDLTVTHFVDNRNADTQADAVTVHGNQAEILFRVKNTGTVPLYKVRTHHRPAQPVDGGWQQQCVLGKLDPGQVRYCKRTIAVPDVGLNKAFGIAQGHTVIDPGNMGSENTVRAINPTYFNVVLP